MEAGSISHFSLYILFTNLYSDSHAILRETSGTTSYQVVRLVFRPYIQFNERFARQYHYCPPLQFPAASTHSNIDHNLSGLRTNKHKNQLSFRPICYQLLSPCFKTGGIITFYLLLLQSFLNYIEKYILVSFKVLVRYRSLVLNNINRHQPAFSNNFECCLL